MSSPDRNELLTELLKLADVFKPMRRQAKNLQQTVRECGDWPEELRQQQARVKLNAKRLADAKSAAAKKTRLQRLVASERTMNGLEAAWRNDPERLARLAEATRVLQRFEEENDYAAIAQRYYHLRTKVLEATAEAEAGDASVAAEIERHCHRAGLKDGGLDRLWRYEYVKCGVRIFHYFWGGREQPDGLGHGHFVIEERGARINVRMIREPRG